MIKVLRNLFGRGVKIHSDVIMIGDRNNHRTLTQELNAKANAEQPQWTKATLQNGWTDDNGYWYRKNTIGQVEIRGGAVSDISGLGTVILTLPPDYAPRPGSTVPITAYNSTIGTILNAFIIDHNGNVIIRENITAGSRHQINTVYVI